MGKRNCKDYCIYGKFTVHNYRKFPLNQYRKRLIERPQKWMDRETRSNIRLMGNGQEKSAVEVTRKLDR